MRTDITLDQWLTRIAKTFSAQKGNKYASYKGAEGAAKLAGDVGYAFLDFPKNQWDDGLKTSWKVARARYGTKPPLTRSNWEFHIRRHLLRK